jgi:CRP-like cAMP-binding protein
LTAPTAELAPEGNGLLAALPGPSRAVLREHLEAVELRPQQTLTEIGDRVAYVYFPAGSVVAGVAIMSDGATVETALVGREGAAGLASLFGECRERYWTRALLPGGGWRLRSEALRELFARDEALRRLLLGYCRILIGQISRRAVCNTRHPLFERLCTWLLMVRDRAGRDELGLTQEVVSRQLGVRRAGVNEAVRYLERAGVVEHGRGRVRLLDRAGLEESACVCYRALKREMRWHGPPADAAAPRAPARH